MTTTSITIEQLAEKLNGKLWVKEDLKRIYLDRGYNTKKMSTKSYIFEKDGEFIAVCNIECPSQDWNWIKSQQQEVVEGINEDVQQAIWEINNPEGDYFEHLENKEIEIEQKQAEEVKAKLEDEKVTAANLTIDNVAKFFLENKNFYMARISSELEALKFSLWSYQSADRLLNVRDDYAPIIYDNAFERIFNKSDKHVDEVWTERIGKVRVGEVYVEFEDEVEFVFVRKQGKNGPNKKNVFKPREIPAHVTAKLNEVLEVEKVKRVEYLKQEFERRKAKLIEAIEVYKQSLSKAA